MPPPGGRRIEETMTQVRTADDRRDHVIDAASDLLESRSIQDISMSSVAEAAGMSRVWIYRFFPDLASIFFEVYARSPMGMASATPAPPEQITALRSFMINRIDDYLDVRPACAIVGAYSLNCVRSTDSELASLADRVFSDLREAWVQPLVSLGNDSHDVWSKIVVFLNVHYGLVISVHRGLVSREAASRRLEEVIHALADGTIGIN
jgi:AcrR family transcriptional regulator